VFILDEATDSLYSWCGSTCETMLAPRHAYDVLRILEDVFPAIMPACAEAVIIVGGDAWQKVG
jgi:hypothetical protein